MIDLLITTDAEYIRRLTSSHVIRTRIQILDRNELVVSDLTNDPRVYIVSGAVHRTVLFSNVRVHSHSIVSWSVLLPEVQVGRRARLTRCVIDRGVVIPDDMVIGEDPVSDAKRFLRSENGITLVTRGMLEKLRT